MIYVVKMLDEELNILYKYYIVSRKKIMKNHKIILGTFFPKIPRYFLCQVLFTLPPYTYYYLIDKIYGCIVTLILY